MIDGPLFVREESVIRRELVALSDSRRTESDTTYPSMLAWISGGRLASPWRRRGRSYGPSA